MGRRSFPPGWVCFSLPGQLKCSFLHSTKSSHFTFSRRHGARSWACLGASRPHCVEGQDSTTDWVVPLAYGGQAPTKLQPSLCSSTCCSLPSLSRVRCEDISDFSSTPPLPPPWSLSGLEGGRGGKCFPSAGTALHHSPSTSLHALFFYDHDTETGDRHFFSARLSV